MGRRCSGSGRATSEQLLHVNEISTMHALEAAVQADAGKFVFASSGAASGFSFQKREIVPHYVPIDEQHPCEPQDEYGLSKLLGEFTCKRYTDAFGIQTICLIINHNWYLDWESAEVAVRSGWAPGLNLDGLAHGGALVGGEVTLMEIEPTVPVVAEDLPETLAAVGGLGMEQHVRQRPGRALATQVQKGSQSLPPEIGHPFPMHQDNPSADTGEPVKRY